MPQRLESRPNEGWDTRIICISDPHDLMARMFGGVIADGRGTIRVGEVDIRPDEMNHALAQSLSCIRDIARDPTNDTSLTFKQIISLPSLLSWRQELLEFVVTKIRKEQVPHTTG